MKPLLHLTAFTLLFCGALPLAAAEKKLNVLFIAVDDMKKISRSPVDLTTHCLAAGRIL